MLLDLLGEKNPTFHSYFLETVDLYRSLITAEMVLNRTGCLSDYNALYFQPLVMLAGIDDDHRPFLEKGW